MNKRNTLLIGSDIDKNRIALRDLFSDYYYLLEASSTEQTLLLLQQNHSIISCVLLDIDHGWDETYELLGALDSLANQKEIPVIVLLSSDADTDAVIMLDTRATDVILKPCPDRVLTHRVGTLIDLYQQKAVLQKRLDEKSKMLQYSNDQMIDVLSNIIEQRSLESGQHIQRIRGFTRIMLEEISSSWPEYGLDQKKIEVMSSAAALHDIGKISIPDSILNKPGYLTKSEFEIMQTHTVNGAQILDQLKGVVNDEYLGYAYNICRYHHERWDGRGYPDGLRRDEIPICAQAAAVADVYDALTTDRIYKAAYHSERAASMILNGECGVFSPKILESFKACFPRFVELEKHYKDNNKEIRRFGVAKSAMAEASRMGESATDRLYARHQALLYYQRATVLEADLLTGVFHLIYNPNPDYRVPEGSMSFFEFANQVANEQIHPADKERYIHEVQHCHSALFELGQRKHSVYARMKGVAIGRYRPYEFSTIRIDSDGREVLLVCHPLDENVTMSPQMVHNDWLEKNPQVQAAFLSNLLFIRHDANLSIVGDIGALWELSGYSGQEIFEDFRGGLMELVYPKDREALMKNIKEQLSVGITVDVDFRIRSKQGQPVWVLGRFYLYTDSNGEEYFCALLQNNTKSHAQLADFEEAALYKEVFLRQSSDISFTWDMEKEEFHFDEKWKQRFGHEPVTSRSEQFLIGAHHLHPDDVSTARAFLEKLRGGASYAEADLRIFRVRGGYLWNRFRAGVICDGEGKAVRAIGSIMDIDPLKHQDVSGRVRFAQMVADMDQGVIPIPEDRKEFFEYTFRRFQETKDFDAELSWALRTIAKAAGAGRVYLYEVDETGKECRRTVQWHDEEVKTFSEEGELLRYSMGYSEWEKMFRGDDILCIPDTSYLSEAEQAVTKDLGVQAILQYKIQENGHVYGFIGLDDYNAPRIWSSEQIEAFRIFSTILSQFLIKNRVQKRSLQQEETLKTILDHQDVWIYIVDEDYCIQFVNEKARPLVPKGRDKQRCYEVFMRRSSPCPGCPAINIKEKGAASVVIEDGYLNLSMRVSATWIRWRGKDAAMLRCTSAGNAAPAETAPRPNPFRSSLHPDVLKHTGSVDRTEPEVMMAALQVLLDHLPGMIFIKDANLVYRASNQAFAEMTKKGSASEVVGKKDFAVFEDQSLARRYIADDYKLLSGGKNLIDYVEPITEDNGDARYTTTSKYILTSQSGNPIGLLGYSRDITKDMRARYQYEKKLDYLFDLPKDVFAVRLIDIDDWRIIGQRVKPINGVDLPDYHSVEDMVDDVKDGLTDDSAKDTLYFYEEFSPRQLRNLYNSGRAQMEMEHLFHFKNGKSSWVRNELKFLINPSNGHRCVMSVVKDIDSNRKSAAEMVKAANTDALTGVMSRGMGVKRMKEFLSGEGKDAKHAMFMVDVDNFKSVNDLFGHPTGDKLLCDMADAIKSCFRSRDFIIRMGGDEFLVLMKNIPNNLTLRNKAENLLEAVRRVRAANTEAMISISVGISVYPENGTTVEELFNKADEALYRAKKSGKNQAAFASDEQVVFDGGNIAMRYEDYNSLITDYAGLFCYISDFETDELLHMNQVAMTAYGIASPESYRGKKCYEVLQGRGDVCPFCTNAHLKEGEPHSWICENEILNKTLHVIDTKVYINGRWCRLEIAQELEDLKVEE